MTESTTQVLEAPSSTSKTQVRYRNSGNSSASKLIREIRRNTARRFDAEYKIRVVLEGFRKDIPITDLCRRERITPSLYYIWLKEFMVKIIKSVIN